MRRLSVLFGFVILGLAILVSAGGTQDAKKDKDDKKEKAKGILPPGFKDLNLTAEQKAKVYSIQGEYKVKIVELDKKIKELKGQEQKEIFGVLTKAQQEQYLKSKGIDSPKDKAPDKKDGDKKKNGDKN